MEAKFIALQFKILVLNYPSNTYKDFAVYPELIIFL